MNEKQEQKQEQASDQSEKMLTSPDAAKLPGQWRIVNQMGRTVRPVSGPGSEKRMRDEFERLRKVGMPGSVQLLDENNRIVEQHGNFSPDDKRRYKDEDGKPYEPTVVNKGATPVDLSKIADAIKAMPETDPDDPDSEPSPSIDEVVKKNRTVSAREQMRKDQEALRKQIRDAKAKAEAVKAKTRKVDPASAVFGAVPKKPRPRSERMRGAGPQPCQGGLSGLISFLTYSNARLSEMRHTEDRARRRRRRFLVELVVRVVFGAPVCSKTAEVAYVDAVDATKV